MQRGNRTNDFAVKNIDFALIGLISYLQMNERVEELICEQSFSDMMYFTENDGKLRLDTFSL